MFSIFDILNSAFSAIATAYIYFMGAAVIVCFVQGIYMRHVNSSAVTNEFYEQTKVLMAVEPEPVVEEEDASEPESVVVPEVVTDFWVDIDFSNMGIRGIRDYVRAHSLQTLVREKLGKSVSKCSLGELRGALV